MGHRWREGRNPCDFGCCGSNPELVIQHWPELADLAALHLSDLDGVPLHAEANSWYWLAGALGGLQEPFHAGNGTAAHTAAKCWANWSAYLRLPLGLRPAQTLIDVALSGRPAALRAWHKEFVQAQKLRWKAEADACIERHQLQVFGDIWPTPAEAPPAKPLVRAEAPQS